MTNEGKILALLERMDNRMENMEIRLEDRMGKLELGLENEAFAPIKILSENVAELANRQPVTEENIAFLVKTIDAIAHKIDDHTVRLERIEDKLESHDIQIHVLDKTKSNKRRIK